MPFGAKRDIEATESARKLHHPCWPLLTDRRSFVSTTRHVFLAGRDRNAARVRAEERATDLNSGYLQCQNCRARIWYDLHPVHPLHAEMHHISRKPRCWCDHNLEMLCRKCHRGGKNAKHA